MRFVRGCSVLLALAGLLVPRAPGQRDTPNAQKSDPHSPTNRPARIIRITARDSTFDPVVIHLKVNEKAELDAIARGGTMGIRISPFPDGAKANTAPGLSFLFGEDCYKLKTNETVPIQIEAIEPGTYTFGCCKGCGPSHGSMRGRIIVDPAP
jgi:Cupredoxin-like domain